MLYPFGMGITNRKFSSNKYRYGFNGKENDNEVKGEGNQQDYGMRIYDQRLGKFISVDPLTKDYPYYSTYQFAGNTPIKFIDLDGGEPKVPDQPEYVGKTFAIDKPFNSTGGDKKYNGTPQKTLGSDIPVDKTKFFANDNGNKSTVNETTQFLLVNENYFKTSPDLVNKLLGDFVWGKGPENIVFPENGKFSNELKGSIAVGESIVKWANNKFNDGVYRWSMDARGQANVLASNLDFSSLEQFIGSCAIKISTKNEKEIKVEVFNVTSFSSGYLAKDIPVVKWFVSTPFSTPRNPTTKSYDGTPQPTYSNTSQYFSFTMSVSEANKLITQFSAGAAPQKK